MRNVITPAIQEEAQLGAFIEYLHACREDERVALARKIHDELGGLLVSAAMDVGWTEAHLSSVDAATRLRRIGSSLANAIDMKRDMIEHLRPSLLDNFGLFEALRWHLKHSCRRSDVACSEVYPPDELALKPRALSQLFRATETLLDLTFMEEDLKSVQLVVSLDENELSIRVGHEHTDVEKVDVLERFRHELTSAAHRLAGFRGELSFDRHEIGLDFYAALPLQGLCQD